MAQNPLVLAVQHFPLAQLLGDSNLCRNVLNDIGAPPAEVFLLAAALDARVPQTLMEHSATDDLSVVEPRLVAELNQRGIERNRAEWAVNAWKEVVAGSTLGQATVMRSSTPAPGGPGHPGPGQPPAGFLPTGPVEAATVRPNAPAAGPGWQSGPLPSGPPVVVGGPPPAPSTVPIRPAPERKRRKAPVIIAVVIVLLLAGGVAAFLATRSNSKHDAGSSSSASKAANPASPSNSASAAVSTPPASLATSPGTSTSTAVSAPATNLNAPLGAAKTVSVAGTAAWTDTGVMVTRGERINVVATGQVAPAAGQPATGPDGVPDPAQDIFTIVGGGHAAGLIGLIAGSNAPFFVGANFNGVAPFSGRLYLGINDTGVENNSGKFTVTLRLQQS